MNGYEYALLTIITLIAIGVGIFYSAQPLNTFIIERGIESVRLAGVMLWETWWALVLGFSIAGAVEAWISRERISNALKGVGLKEISLGAFFGFISSSCSFSAIATAKNLFKKGASAAASLGAFMFASTNLVIEIGIVMWILLGWQFVLADFIGGFILIILMSIILTYLVPGNIIENAREYALKEGDTVKDPVCGMEFDREDASCQVEYEGKTYYFCSEGCREDFDPEEMNTSFIDNLTSRKGWKKLAETQWKEWRMLWEDIAVGFILAGIIGAFIPDVVWTSIFTNQMFGLPIFIILTSILGAVIGIITFVCSVGNVPFAAVLWGNGMPFGSILSYIYSDLIIPPIMDAYKKYYSTKFAIILSASIFITTVLTGIFVHFTFLGFGLIPSHSTATIIEKGIELNYKAWLNLIFLGIFIFLYYLKSVK